MIFVQKQNVGAPLIGARGRRPATPLHRITFLSRAGRSQPRFLLIFSLLLITVVTLFLILTHPKEVSARLPLIATLFKAKPESRQVINIPLPDPKILDGMKALDETARLLAIGPRCSGTDGAKLAAEHIAGRLKALGLEPVIDEFTEMTPDGEKTFRNIMGELQGPTNSIIILLSHYDTKSGISPDFQGANDSGSSTGLLLEIARVLKQFKPGGATILFAFLDGEECIKEYSPGDGLHGSRRLVHTLIRNMRSSRVKAVIVLDMIGDANLNIGIPRNSDRHLASLIFDSAKEEGTRARFSLSEEYILDDHVPFLQADMPAIDIIDFDYGSEPGKNDYWHTEKDTIDKLSADSLQTVGRVVIRTLNKINVL